MKNFTLFSGKRFIVRLALAATMIVFGGEKVWAEELTVYSDKTSTNTQIPVAGGSVGSNFVKSEFIIPSSEISNLEGKSITGLSFYLNASSDIDWGVAEFVVFLKDVDVLTQSAYSGYESQDVVYSGGLSISSGILNISFTSSFIHSSSKNLLIGVYCTKKGTNSSSISYLGYIKDYTASTKGVSLYGATSANQAYFIPRTKFTYQDVVNPSLQVSPIEVDFGTVRSADIDGQVITVTNTGVGSMDVTISNDNTSDFTTSTTSLTSIGAGESKTFDVTFNYNGESLGEKSANITITPDYDADDAKVIAVSAKSVDPKLWEDFSEGIPSTWYNEDNGWITNKAGYSGEAYVNNSSMMLRTPRLTAVADEDISFDVNIGASGSLYKIIATYSTNRINWTEIGTYTTSGTQTFTAPSAGDYWLQFTGFQSSIDNMTGWTVSDVTHEVRLGTATIPTSGTHHGTYTASVNVMELGGSNETLTAKLYFGEDVVATEEDFSISGNRDETIELSYTPLEAWSGKVYIEVTGDNIETLTTSEINVTINNPIVLDETISLISTKPECSKDVIQFKYTPQAGWGTICVPFSLTGHMDTIFGTGWTAYDFTSYSEGQLTFSKQTYVGSVSKPYLVYSPNAESSVDGFYLQGVTISSGFWTSGNLAQSHDDVTFQGTLAPKAPGSLDGCYGVTASGQIAKGSDKAWMNGYRAYLTGIPDGSSVKMFVIDGDDATDVGLMQMVEGEDKAVYNISGQRVQKARKGLYIIGGKKVIIK